MSKTTPLTGGAATEAIVRPGDRICLEGNNQRLNASTHPWLQRSRNGSSLRRPADTTMLRRHDLLRAEPPAWHAMLRDHPSIADLPLVADWARLDRPVIVRRRIVGDFAGSVPAALPLPPCHGKRRLAFTFSSSDALTALPPVFLRDAARAAPAEWQPVIAALLDFGDTIETAPRVFGALLWEYATGLPYLSAQSDLDLLWSISDERTARSLVERLRRLDAESSVRLDGELELPDGAGVSWRELARNIEDQYSDVLVKTMDVVEVRTKAALFRIPVSLS
jgi:phosphoribosyl-dephospho-CoA transferase